MSQLGFENRVFFWSLLERKYFSKGSIMNGKRHVLFFLIIMITTTISAQPEKEEEQLTIDERMDGLFFEWNRFDRPGGSAAVIKNGEILFRKSYGLASLEHPVHNSNATIYDITAIAEQFTAMAVILLESEGSLSFDTSITKYLPEFNDSFQSVTIDHLLNHTSGLSDWTIVYQLTGGYLEDVITSEQVMKLIQKQQEPEFEPGTEFKYSATNYTLLAEIIERITGQSFRDWVWENIFRPVKMTRTMVADRYGEPVENCAEAYDYHARRGYQKGTRNLEVPGAHCLFSSINDMAEWLTHIDSPDKEFKKQIEKILTPKELKDGKKLEYSHGFYVDSYKGLKRYSASGQWQGFNSAFHYYPEENFGVIILCNWISHWVDPVYQAGQIADIYLEGSFTEPEQPPSSEETPEKDFVPDPRKLDQFIGDYRWEPGENFAIIKDNDQLLYQYSPTGKLNFSQLSEDKFVLTGYAYFFTFQKDTDDRVTQCLIQNENMDDVSALKIDIVNPSQEQLAEYTGNYYSKNLDTRYSVRLEDKKLILTHRRLSNINLEPEEKDHFTSGSRLFPLVEFERNTKGDISGFKIKNSNFFFSKTNETIVLMTLGSL